MVNQNWCRKLLVNGLYLNIDHGKRIDHCTRLDVPFYPNYAAILASKIPKFWWQSHGYPILILQAVIPFVQWLKSYDIPVYTIFFMVIIPMVFSPGYPPKCHESPKALPRAGHRGVARAQHRRAKSCALQDAFRRSNDQRFRNMIWCCIPKYSGWWFGTWLLFSHL